MSLFYIIDGYNIIKQVPFFLGKPLKDGRDGLIRFLETNRRILCGNPHNSITVVFDGKADTISPKYESSIEVIFSKGESADDKIKKMVEYSKNPKVIVVVTDDKEIRFFVRALGAKVLSIKVFMSKFLMKNKNDILTSKEKFDIHSEQAQTITSELKNIWLKKE